jgi:hypothetical protein
VIEGLAALRLHVRRAIIGPAVVIALHLSACAHTDDWRFSDDYYVTTAVTGCATFGSPYGGSHDRSIVPTFAFQQTVNALLKNTACRLPELEQSLKEVAEGVMCFYEKPNKDIKVLIGDICDRSVEVTFQKDRNGWGISQFHAAITLCHRVSGS